MSARTSFPADVRSVSGTRSTSSETSAARGYSRRRKFFVHPVRQWGRATPISSVCGYHSDPPRPIQALIPTSESRRYGATEAASYTCSSQLSRQGRSEGAAFRWKGADPQKASRIGLPDQAVRAICPHPAGWHDVRSRRQEMQISHPKSAYHTISIGWPDGGVVTQRTANPCTPVRFRLGPPSTPFPAENMNRDCTSCSVLRHRWCVIVQDMESR